MAQDSDVMDTDDWPRRSSLTGDETLVGVDESTGEALTVPVDLVTFDFSTEHTFTNRVNIYRPDSGAELVLQRGDAATVKAVAGGSAGVVQTTNNYPLWFGTNGRLSDLVVSATGNVGIGTDAPGAKLDVQGKVRLTRNANVYSEIDGNSSTDFIFTANLSQANVQPNFIWRLSAGAGSVAERMRLDNSGNLGVGRSNPSERVDINGAYAINGYRIANITTSNVLIGSEDPSVSTIRFRAAGATVFTANATGVYPTLGDGTLSLGLSAAQWSDIYLVNSPTVSSDATLKQDDRDFTDAELDAWESVRWCLYRLKAEVEREGPSAVYHFGLIAQELIAAFDNLGLDATECGIVRMGDDGLWKVRYTECHVIEAAYQRRRADRAEARLDAIEGRLDAAGI